MDDRGLLAEAGWYAGRDVGQGESGIDALSSAGFVVTPAAAALLREFSGLTVFAPDSTRSLWIDGAQAAALSVPGWVEAYSECCARPLVPVGGYSHMTLLVDDSGEVWGGFDAEFGWLGASVAEVVRGLLLEPGTIRLDRRLPAL